MTRPAACLLKDLDPATAQVAAGAHDHRPGTGWHFFENKASLFVGLGGRKVLVAEDVVDRFVSDPVLPLDLHLLLFGLGLGGDQREALEGQRLTAAPGLDEALESSGCELRWRGLFGVEAEREAEADGHRLALVERRVEVQERGHREHRFIELGVATRGLHRPVQHRPFLVDLEQELHFNDGATLGEQVIRDGRGDRRPQHGRPKVFGQTRRLRRLGSIAGRFPPDRRSSLLRLRRGRFFAGRLRLRWRRFLPMARRRSQESESEAQAEPWSAESCHCRG